MDSTEQMAPGIVRQMREHVRSILTWVLSTVVGVIVTAVACEWFIEVAKDKGLYDNAGQRWDLVMGPVLDFITSGVVLYPLVALAGVVGGLWIDALLKRHTKGVEPAAIVEGQESNKVSPIPAGRARLRLLYREGPDPEELESIEVYYWYTYHNKIFDKNGNALYTSFVIIVLFNNEFQHNYRRVFCSSSDIRVFTKDWNNRYAMVVVEGDPKGFIVDMKFSSEPV